MTPRPQVPQQGTASSTPRLQPIARPTGRGGGGGAGVTGQAANFASLSETLTRAIASVQRVGLEERREDEFLAGQAAAEEAPSGLSEKELIDQGIIPPSASRAWRKGFYNILGRSQADRFQQEVIGPWMRENASGSALVDENGVPLPRRDPLEELKRLRSEFISGMGMGSNVDFLAGYNTYADRDIDKAADTYTQTVNNWEEERVASLVTADLGNSIQDWYEAEGALPTTESLRAYSEKMRSLKGGKIREGYEVPLPDNPSEYGFIAIEQFVSERVRDENADLDAVGAFVHELLNHDGLNGNRNYADDPVYRERVDRLLSGLDSAENRAEVRRNKQREERKRMLQENAAIEFGALDAPELVDLREELAAGTGVFADYIPDDRKVLMQYWSTLITNSNNADKVQRGANTDEVIGYLTQNKDHLSREGAETVMLSRAETHGVDIPAVQRTINSLYGEETTEITRQVQTTLASSQISGAKTSLKTAYSGLSSNDQSAIQARVGELEGAMEAAVRSAIEEGDTDKAEGLIQTFVDDLKILTDASKEKFNRREEGIRSGMDALDVGDFDRAESAIRRDRTMDESKRTAYLAQIDQRMERERQDHAITDARGVTADVYARLRTILSGISRQGPLGQLIADPQLQMASDDKPQTAVSDQLGLLLVEMAEEYRTYNRGRFTNYAEYKSGLADHLNKEVNNLFEELGSDEEKRAFRSFGLDLPGTLTERVQRYISLNEIETTQVGEYQTDATGPVAEMARKARVGAEKGLRTPIKQFQTQGEVRAFDPVEPAPMSPPERYQVGLWEATSDQELAPRVAFEYLAATRGFSVSEVTSGKVDASLPAAAVERMTRNRERVRAHRGLALPTGYGKRRGLPGREMVDASPWYDLFYNADEYKADKAALLAHYDSILENPTRVVDVDTSYIARKAVEAPGTVLVFGSLSEIDEYENNPDHPYRSLLAIPDEARAGFIDAQRRLFDTKKEKGYK